MLLLRTFATGFLEGPVAFPIIPRMAEMGVLWNRHSDTGIVVRAIPPVTFPTGSVRRFNQVPVRRHFYGHAGFVDFPITAIACPAEPERRIQKEPVGRDFDQDTSFIDLTIASVTFPIAAVGIQIRMLW